MSTATLGTRCTWIAGMALMMSLATGAAQAQGIPGGSYAATCTHIQTYGSQVTADCRRMDGSWGRSSVDARGCPGGIANTDGQLTCGGSYGEGSGEGWNRNRYEGSGYRSHGRYYNGYGR
jgi:hypothetical protein